MFVPIMCACMCIFLCNMSSIEFHTDKLLAHGM